MRINSAQIRTYLYITGVTLAAYLVELCLPALSSAFSALVIGMLVGHYHTVPAETKKVGSQLLKYSIILLGFGLSFAKLQSVGFKVYLILIPVILGSFAIAHIVGKRFNIASDARVLVGIGTAICGGSAIAAAAPIIEAEDDSIAFSITTVFLYNMLALILFPILGNWLHLQDITFGVFAGAAVNDTSSVIATGFAFSDTAGTIATIVKMARTLMIVPACLTLLFMHYRSQKTSKLKLSHIQHIFPTFILGFLLAVTLTSILPLPSTLLFSLKWLSRFATTAALAAVGLSVKLAQLRTAGLNAILLGGITWLGVILISIGLIQLLY